MTRIGRNELCLCGSGVKFKKCCLNKIKSSDYVNDHDFDNFILNNSSSELLQIFALLQLCPENHSKVFRLEIIQDSIIKNLNRIISPVDYRLLKKTIDKNFDSNINEDPSECSFTENISFVNGNNIVFPGIANESTNIIQMLINAIFVRKNDFDVKFTDKIKSGLLFFLHVSNDLAKKLSYSRYINCESRHEKIVFPSDQFIEQYKGIFKFTKEDIELICKLYNISPDIILEFLTDESEMGKLSRRRNSFIKKTIHSF